MDIKRFNILLMIADYGTLTRTAEEIGYTQSGVSNIIKTLEAEIGFPLLYRHRRGVSLTENAKRLVPIIRELSNWSDQLGQVISEINGVESGTVSVASVTSISVHWLPKIFKQFQRDYPNISVNLYEGGDREVLKWMNEGRVDLAFCCDQPKRDYEWIHLFDDELVAVLPERHPLARRRIFPLSAFNNERFVMMPEDYHHETKRIFEEHGITPDIRFSATDDHTTIAMVEEGLGLSMLSRIVMEAYPHREVTALELNPACPRSLGIALRFRGELSPAALKFIATSKSVIAQ